MAEDISTAGCYQASTSGFQVSGVFMATVTWMWLGNRAPVNATSATPSTEAEADDMAGYGAVGTAQIKPVAIQGDTRTITNAKKPTSASVTAPIIAMRAGPSRVKNSIAPFTASGPADSSDRIAARPVGKNFPVLS